MESHDDWVNKVGEAVKDVSDALNADVILFSGEVSSPSDREFVEMVQQRDLRKNVFFLLTTDGGSADAAYRICRCLQQNYTRVILFVDSYCKSAGTLIALGADEIVMANVAELGPLDVQLYKPDELSELTSGLTPIQALSTLQGEMFKTFEHSFLKLRFRSGLQITTRTAADIAARLTIGLFRSVYAQLDPMRLGEYQRAMLIAQHYGTRLARKNLKDSALDRLIADYPSHGFVIDRCEAETLFHKVREPTPAEYLLSSLIKPLVRDGLAGEEAKVDFLTDDAEAEIEHEKTNDGSGEVSPTSGTDRHATPGNGRSQPVRSGTDATDGQDQRQDSEGTKTLPS
jgi:hypothetical protein